MAFSHTTVLLQASVDALNVRGGYTYVDCTTGGGGHSELIAQKLPSSSRLLCIDRDEAALDAASKRLLPYADRITFVHANFKDLDNILKEEHVENLGGVLMDLGCSSYQFDTPSRGFSYQHDAPLDMRMDQTSDFTAADVVNQYSASDLQRIIYEYGEEKFASRIAQAIVHRRESGPIRTTGELVQLIKQAIPAAARSDGPHPAKRTFQAIRIEVNGELDVIAPTIEAAARHLLPTGRLAVISFHSLEDRPVKQTYAALASGCTCPKDFPVCVCGKKPILKPVTHKPVLPSDEELNDNPRARSAKLRVAERV